MRIECNLVLKENGPVALKREIEECFLPSTHITRHTRGELSNTIAKAVFRIANLKSEKFVVVFMRGLAHYRLETEQIRNKKRSKHSSVSKG